MPPVTTSKRFARSLAESFSFYPDWRARQVRNHLDAKKYANDSGQTFQLPSWETDDEVVRLYAMRTEAAAFDQRDLRRFDYSDEAIDHNSRTGQASRVRALVCARETPAEIAARMGTTTENIETFLRLHFDVLNCWDNREYMSAIVFPFTVERGESAMDRKERVLRSTSFMLGVKGYEMAMYKSVVVNEAELEAMNRQLRSLMIANALDWVIGRRSGAFPSQTDMEMYIQGQAAIREEVSDKGKEGDKFLEQMLQIAIEERQTSTVSAHSSETSTVRSAVISSGRRYANLDFRRPVDDSVYYSGDRGKKPLGFLN